MSPVALTTDINIRCCATCAYWRGIKVIYRDYVKVKSLTGECRCPKNLKYVRSHDFECLNYESVKS